MGLHLTSGLLPLGQTWVSESEVTRVKAKGGRTQSQQRTTWVPATAALALAGSLVRNDVGSLSTTLDVTLSQHM